MRSSPRSGRTCFTALAVLAAVAVCSVPSAASAYNGHPKLVVVIVIDQFRGDYLERYRDQFGDGGFRFLLDHGAYFPNCNYDYANTRTAPGHSTLFTGAYSNGHGIAANEWWDPKKKRMVTSVEDDGTKLVGVAGDRAGASPHNLLADTLGDELKLATQGQARVFGVSLKDRAAVLPAGFAGDAAYWIEPKSGAWVTSTYYRDDLPKWVQDFNSSLAPTNIGTGNGRTRRGPCCARRLIARRKTAPSRLLRSGWLHRLRQRIRIRVRQGIDGVRERGPRSGHRLAFDQPLAQRHSWPPGGTGFSGNAADGARSRSRAGRLHQLPRTSDRAGQRVDCAIGRPRRLLAARCCEEAAHPGGEPRRTKLLAQINGAITAKFSPGHPAEYVKLDYPLAWLDQDAFAAAHVREHDAEAAVGEAMKQAGLRDYYTKSQLAAGEVPNTALGRKFLNSYSPEGRWYVMGVPDFYTVGSSKGTDHASPYNYDTHVPLAFYGLPFQAGTYRTHAEPVDLAATLASLLGINAPDPLHRTGADRGARARAPQPDHGRRPAMTASSTHSGRTTPDLSVSFAGIPLKNPVIAASGTFGYGVEFEDVVHLSKLGGFVVKGLSKEPMTGNPPPRLWETAAGMLNAIGLQNIGAQAFLDEKLPHLRQIKNIVVMANVFGYTREDYERTIEILNDGEGIAAYELNVSCPNTAHGGMQFGSDPRSLDEVVTTAKRVARRPLIVKLSPNVTSIAQMAYVAQEAGADALSLVNTFVAMAIDPETRKPAHCQRNGRTLRSRHQAYRGAHGV